MGHDWFKKHRINKRMAERCNNHLKAMCCRDLASGRAWTCVAFNGVPECWCEYYRCTKGEDNPKKCSGCTSRNRYKCITEVEY